jgi:UDP-glucose 4-epimerase
VLITSTSEIYGKNNTLPFREEDDRVLGPTTKSRWSYSDSKAIDEFLSLAYWKEKKLPVVIVRLFNTIGPRQSGQYGMVVPRFISQAIKNEPITVYGYGAQSRCFCYVTDTVSAMIKLMESPESVGEIFNVGSTEVITIMELARLIKKIVASESKIITIPYEAAYESGFEDMKSRIPDISKIMSFVRWRPTMSLEEMLNRIVMVIAAQNGNGQGHSEACQHSLTPNLESGGEDCFKGDHRLIHLTNCQGRQL